MFTLLMILQFLVCFALIGVILLQRSKGEGLGAIGGSAQLFFDQAKGLDRTLVRATSVLAAVFLLLSLVLSMIS